MTDPTRNVKPTENPKTNTAIPDDGQATPPEPVPPEDRGAGHKTGAHSEPKGKPASPPMPNKGKPAQPNKHPGN